jgi:hypothetical protein
MKWLMIENNGELNPHALTLMGASTKRHDNSKIGFYGSGNKYAIALLLRLGVPFEIFSGTRAIIPVTERIEFGNEVFDKIKFNVETEVPGCFMPIETSLTVQMGPQWEPWFAVRELYCNAVDEGGCQVVPMTSTVAGAEGKTRFFIGINEHIEPVLSKWNTYFSSDRIDLFAELPGVRLYFRQNKGMRVYRKGILVYENDKLNSVFDYDVDEAQINESRVLENTYYLQWNLQRTIAAHGDRDVIKRLLLGMHMAELEKTELFEKGMDFRYGITNNVDNWKGAIDGFQFVNSNVAGRYADEVKQDSTLILPSALLHILQDSVNEELPAYGIPRKGVVSCFKPFVLNEDQIMVLTNATRFLKNAGVTITSEIKVVRFDDDGDRMGMADMGGKIIYVGSRAFDQGTKIVARVILEEHVHITERLHDETRNLQNYLFDKWMTEMELRTGQYL